MHQRRKLRRENAKKEKCKSAKIEKSKKLKKKQKQRNREIEKFKNTKIKNAKQKYKEDIVFKQWHLKIIYTYVCEKGRKCTREGNSEGKRQKKRNVKVQKQRNQKS